MTEPGQAEQLSVGDRMTFWVETPTSAFQIGLAGVLDAEALIDAAGALRLEELCADLDRRSSTVPRFRQRVRWSRLGNGRPAWVLAEPLDMAAHVGTDRVPSPGDEQAWLAWCATTSAVALDRDKPLWRITFATGRADGTVGMLLVVHHAVVDGIAGVAALECLFADDLRPAPEPQPVGGGLQREAPRPRLRTLPRAVGRMPQAARVVRDVTQQLRTKAPPVWPGPIDATRQLAVVRRPLDRVHDCARRLDSTVNDLVLAAVATGLRDLALAHGQEPPARPMRASMPIAVPGPRVNVGRLVIVDLPVTEMSIIDRLHEIVAQTRELKRSGDLTHADVTNAKGFPVFLVRAAMEWASRRAGTRVNLYVTNVVGPSGELRLGRARLSELVPISPLSAGVHLGVTVFSYAGELTLSLHVDGAIEDVNALAASVDAALDQLAPTATVEQDRRRTGSTPG